MSQADAKSQRYITEHEVEAITGRKVQTLRNDRHKGRGFPYRKFGRQVRYYLPEILTIMEQHRIDPGSF
jgi:hypothetical protein